MIVSAAIGAADAGVCTQTALPAISEIVGSATAWHLVAAGKAAAAMARVSVDAFDRPPASAMAVAREGLEKLPPYVRTILGGHPVPSPASVEAASCALDIARSAAETDVVVVLLSGGASALLALPVEDVPLEDKQTTTDRLLRAGSDIWSLNAVRKHLSAIKGGRLAAATRARLVCLAMSDVVGDDLSVIGSGPTVGDPTSFSDALAVIDRFGGPDRFPSSVVSALRDGAAGRRPETPKPNASALRNADTRVVGSRKAAMSGAAVKARELGYRTLVTDEPVVGEARAAAAVYAASLVALTRTPRLPLCVVSSGETTVTVSGSGRGGRNQEFALALTDLIAADAAIVVASAGTDGIDGPTDAAGAIVTSTTRARAAEGGLNPREFLNNNNAYAFFARLHDLIVTGPTGTNVGDVQIALIDAPEGPKAL